MIRLAVFGVWLGRVGLLPPIPISSSTPANYYTTLPLKAFRREPDIEKFDKPFTPIHRSSENFSPFTGSGLQALLQALHPAHG